MITKNQYLTFVELPTVEGADKLITEMDDTPLAVRFGVGGTQALVAILSDPNITEDQKVNMMVVLFSISEEDARRIMYGNSGKKK